MKRFGHLSMAGIMLSALLGVFIGVSGFTFRYAEGASYLSNDPAACVNCHIMRDQYDGWQKSAHHAHATCNDCHVPHDFFGKYATKAEHGYRHSKGFTFQNFHEPIQIKESSLNIVQANCVRCHESLVGDITAHNDPVKGMVNCVQCHSRVGHGATP